MSNLSLLSANLAVVVIESSLYGVYAVLASFTFYCMVKRHRDRRPASTGSLAADRDLGSHFRVPAAIAYLALFVVITSHWLLNVSRLFIAFHRWDDGIGPAHFYGDLSHTTEVVKYGILVAAMLLSGCIGIYNAWVIWGFSTRVIILPVFMLVGLTVFGVGLTYQMSVYTSGDSIFEAAFRRWFTGVCFFGLAGATYTTGLIWYRLWNNSQELKSLGITSVSEKSSKIFIHSAGLLTAWSLFHTVSYHSGSNIQYIVSECIPVMSGISKVLIQIRMHWHLIHDQV